MNYGKIGSLHWHLRKKIRRKLAKIVEIGDHNNIDPRVVNFFTLLARITTKALLNL
jgi:hypothetical protein